MSLLFSASDEKMILGGMMAGKRNFKTGVSRLKADDFYFLDNQNLFNTIMKIGIETGEAEVLTVISELEKTGYHEPIGEGGLFHMVENCPFDISPVCNSVKFYSEKRQILEHANESTKLATEALTKAELDESKTALLHGMLERQDGNKGEVNTHDSIIHEAERPGGIPWPAQWNIKKFRWRGKPNILAGFAGSGKTRTAVNLVVDEMIHGLHTLFISVEMSPGEIKTMVMAQFVFSRDRESNALTEMARKYKRNPGKYKDIVEMIDKTITVIDGNKFTFEDVQREFMAYKVRKGFYPDSLFVDYVQKLQHPDKRLQKYHVVSENMNSLTALVKNTRTALTIPAQTNRTGKKDKKSENFAPDLEDLKNSGALEEDAALVCTFARYPSEENILEYFWPKDRYGSIVERTRFKYDGKTGYILGQEDYLKDIEVAAKKANIKI